MLINSSNLDALFISFSKVFENAYMSYPNPLADAIATRVPSNTRDQRYPFVQSLSGAMRQWTGERRLQNVVVDGFVVTNKLWENNLAIQRTDLEFDQYAVYSNMLIPNLARHAKLLADQQIAAEIAANNTGFDGKAIFATDHPTDPSGANTGTQSNTTTGKPLNSTNLAAVQALMMNFVGPDKIPLGTRGNILLVPPSLEYTANTLANAAYFPESKNNVSGVFGSQTNMFAAQYNVVTSPYLTDSGDPTTAVWYLIDGRDKATMPFLWQEFAAPQLVSVTDPGAYPVFMQDKFLMGARAIAASAPSLWFRIFKVSGA